jgi:ribonuclease HII
MPPRAHVVLDPGPPGLCGVDEVGRGPLAGPVVTAAVILDPARPVPGLRDSKQLSASARDELAGLIRERALAYHIAEASVAEIDKLNILNATLLAMRRAVEGLASEPVEIWVDGNRCPIWKYRSQAIVKGDQKIAAIAAASILAKCWRDTLMIALHDSWPQYGFDRHMGYGTPQHLAALEVHGVCPIHRMSFAPVRARAQR